jgi:hypothetical protein
LEEQILAISKTVDGGGFWLIGRVTIWEVYTSGGKKGPDPVIARTTVHISEVIGLTEIPILKEIRPGTFVNLSGSGDDPIEVPQHR